MFLVCDDAERYLDDIESYRKHSVFIDVENHSFEYLKNELSDRKWKGEYTELDSIISFVCYRDIWNKTDKWNPSIEQESYCFDVKPSDPDSFTQFLRKSMGLSDYLIDSDTSTLSNYQEMMEDDYERI